MKTIITILILLAYTTQAGLMEQVWARRGAGAIVGYQPPGWSKSLVWWKFSETSGTNIADYSKTGTNTGYVVQRDADWGYSEGSFVTALVSNTPNAYVMSRSLTLLNGETNATFSAWTKVRDFGTSSGIACFRQSGGVLTGLAFTTSTNRAGAYWGSSGYVLREPLPYRSAGTWDNITAVKSGESNMVLYINGVSVSTNSAVVPVGKNFSAALAVPRDEFSAWAREYVGSVDDVYITTYPFTPADVYSHYLQGRSQ